MPEHRDRIAEEPLEPRILLCVSAFSGGIRSFAVSPPAIAPANARSDAEFAELVASCDQFEPGSVCDWLKPSPWSQLSPVGIHRAWRPHGRKSAPQRARSSNEYLRHPRVRAVTGARRVYRKLQPLLAPPSEARSFFNATSLSIGAMPQLVQGNRWFAGTNFSARSMVSATC